MSYLEDAPLSLTYLEPSRAWQRVPQTLCHTRAHPPHTTTPCHRLNTTPGYMSSSLLPRVSAPVTLSGAGWSFEM